MNIWYKKTCLRTALTFIVIDILLSMHAQQLKLLLKAFIEHNNFNPVRVLKLKKARKIRKKRRRLLYVRTA